MELSELTLRLVVLLVPGAVAALVVEKLTEHRPWSPFAFVLHSILLGTAAYFAHQGFWYAMAFITGLWAPFNVHLLSFWASLFDSSIAISLGEVALTCLFSIAVAYIVSAGVNHKVLFRSAQFLRVSRKFGDEDVWAYFLNSEDVHWVWVRDHARGLAYAGWVQAFSATPPVREIVLREVEVFSNERGELLYRVPAMYVAGEPSEITVELPPRERADQNREESELDTGIRIGSGYG